MTDDVVTAIVAGLALTWGVALVIDGVLCARRSRRRARDERDALRTLLAPTPPCDASEHRRRLEQAEHDHTN